MITLASKSSDKLTPRQLDLAILISRYRHEHGIAPSMQELADAQGVSKVTVFEHIGELEKKGVIRRDKNKARSIEIIGEDRLPAEQDATLPVLGHIAAGSPIEAVENRQAVDLATIFKSKCGVRVVRLRGDNVAENTVDGDYLVIELRNRVRNGEQVVVTVGRASILVMRYYRDSSTHIRLVDGCRGIEPLIVEASECDILGVVIGMVRL